MRAEWLKTMLRRMFVLWNTWEKTTEMTPEARRETEKRGDGVKIAREIARREDSSEKGDQVEVEERADARMSGVEEQVHERT